MWGSWIGFLFGSFHIIGATLNPNSEILEFIFKNIIVYLNPIAIIDYHNCNDVGCGLITVLSSPIVFFLIGWAIHSLIRKITSN